MTDQASFEIAYRALLANHDWQSSLHGPVMSLDGDWRQFLRWMARSNFVAIVIHLLLRLLAIAVIGVLVAKLSTWWRTRNAFPIRKTLAPWPTQPSSVAPQTQTVSPVALMEEADRLAQAGSFLEAMSMLFKAAVGAVNNSIAIPIEAGATLREVGNRDFPRETQSSFRTIGTAIELDRFAGAPTDAASYEECRRACQHLIKSRARGV